MSPLDNSLPPDLRKPQPPDRLVTAAEVEDLAAELFSQDELAQLNRLLEFPRAKAPRVR